jgi:hypothetical protein
MQEEKINLYHEHIRNCSRCSGYCGQCTEGLTLLNESYESVTTKPNVDKCVKCGHNDVFNGLCTTLVPLIERQPHGMKQCRCACVFPNSKSSESVSTNADVSRLSIQLAQRIDTAFGITQHLCMRDMDYETCSQCADTATQIAQLVLLIEQVFAGYQSAEWQPIETAPKDGTSILVATEEGVQLVAWLDNNTSLHSRKFMEWCEPGSWQDEQGGYTIADNPTHWTPLPNLPKTDSENSTTERN